MQTKTLAALAVLACVTAAQAQLFFPNFNSMTGLNVAGSAFHMGNIIRMTPAADWVAGNAWAVTPQSVRTGFTTNFEFRSTGGTHLQGADGMAFAIQNNNPSQVGMNGGNMSVTGIANAVAVVFRSFHADVGLWKTDASGNRTVIASVIFPGISRNTPWEAEIDYDGATHDWIVKLDDVTVLNANYDVQQTVPLTADKAFVGFGSATGGQNDNNDLNSWRFTPTLVPEPASLGIMAIGVVALLRRRTKR